MYRKAISHLKRNPFKQKDPLHTKKKAEQLFGNRKNVTPFMLCVRAKCYEEGLGMAKNTKKALRLYKISARKNYPIAQYKLGEFYSYGIHTNPLRIDDKKAFKYYKLAADQSYSTAQYKVGIYYEYGKDPLLGDWVLPADDKQAFKYYKLAADQKHCLAQYKVGEFYEYGRGILADEKRAFSYYKLAASQNHCMAQYKMGSYYEYGSEPDKKRAFKYYKLAADQGNLKAKRALNALSKVKLFAT